MNTNLLVGPVHCAWDPLPLITSKHNTEMCHTSGSHALFTGPTNPIFSAISLLKMGLMVLFTHLKNYFVTVFSVFSFQQNKRYSNRP